jgi:hypothetical protein
VIKYATDCATNEGKGATRQIMFNAIVFLRAGDRKPLPTWKWFQYWLKATPKVHKIKTKPIASQRVDIHIKKDIFDWFKNVLRPAIYRRNIYNKSQIHNINEKGARLGCSAGQKVIVPVYIKEMYIRVPKNRKYLTIIKLVATDKTAILPVVIVLR